MCWSETPHPSISSLRLPLLCTTNDQNCTLCLATNTGNRWLHLFSKKNHQNCQQLSFTRWYLHTGLQIENVIFYAPFDNIISSKKIIDFRRHYRRWLFFNQRGDIDILVDENDLQVCTGCICIGFLVTCTQNHFMQSLNRLHHLCRYTILHLEKRQKCNIKLLL